MLAHPKAQVALGPALNVVNVGIAEFAPIAITGSEGERHLVAGFELLSVQLRLAHDGALEALCRCVEAQRFFNCRRNEARLRDNTAAGIGIVVQIEREHAHEA